MASVLRSPAVDSDLVKKAGAQLLVDPDWQELIDEATEQAYLRGRDEGKAEGRREGMAEVDRVTMALRDAVEEVRALTRTTRAEAARQVTANALDIVEHLVGGLPIDGDSLIARVAAALDELDEDRVAIEASPDDVEHLEQGLRSEPGVEIVADPDLSPGEVRIVGEWGAADLRWETVLAVLKEELDA